MVSVALRGEGGVRARTRELRIQCNCFFCCHSVIFVVDGGRGWGSAAKHRGEKVWNFFKFYRGGVKILPRYRNYTTTVP